MNHLDAEHSREAQQNKAFLLCSVDRQLDQEKVSAYLGALSEDQIIKLKFGGFGTIIFDLIFDSSVIPKDPEKTYESAFNSYFHGLYGQLLPKSRIVVPGKVFRPEEHRFYDHSDLGPNSPNFLREWVANFRAVYLMMQHFRPTSNNLEKIKSGFVEISLWKIFDESGELHEELLHLLPILEQNKILEGMEIVREMKQWQPSPRQLNGFFEESCSASELAANPVLRVIAEDRLSLAEHLEEELQAEQEKLLHVPTQKLPRHILLPDLLHNEKQLQTWIDLILGLNQGKLPSLHRSN